MNDIEFYGHFTSIFLWQLEWGVFFSVHTTWKSSNVIKFSRFFVHRFDGTVFLRWIAQQISVIFTIQLALLSPHSSVCSTDPQGVNLTSKLSKVGRLYKVDFVGHTPGEHHVALNYGGVPVPGSPFTCLLVDITRVRISDITPWPQLGRPVSFAGAFM